MDDLLLAYTYVDRVVTLIEHDQTYNKVAQMFCES